MLHIYQVLQAFSLVGGVCEAGTRLGRPEELPPLERGGRGAMEGDMSTGPTSKCPSSRRSARRSPSSSGVKRPRGEKAKATVTAGTRRCDPRRLTFFQHRHAPSSARRRRKRPATRHEAAQGTAASGGGCPRRRCTARRCGLGWLGAGCRRVSAHIPWAFGRLRASRRRLPTAPAARLLSRVWVFFGRGGDRFADCVCATSYQPRSPFLTATNDTRPKAGECVRRSLRHLRRRASRLAT